ncbi:MAG: DUF423 domain-containing protein [Flavobacteriales bacterium]|nr:DUF423 domain-containing protein [Flavobacteriales bacterium]MCX7767503.1 DUF423 domain-containing protein [Flavobacteriales bacterium]MDW8409638.1 DUF423 domain-containing protein [Flavobacteriales bacterium]
MAEKNHYPKDKGCARWIGPVGAAFGFLTVALGAVGAHLLRSQLSPPRMEQWQTAVQYQALHALSLLLVASLQYAGKSGPLLFWAGRLYVAGILCFCGSLYLLSTRELLGLSLSWLQHVTPLGGLLWLVAWALMVVKLCRN